MGTFSLLDLFCKSIILGSSLFWFNRNLHLDCVQLFHQQCPNIEFCFPWNFHHPNIAWLMHWLCSQFLCFAEYVIALLNMHRRLLVSLRMHRQGAKYVIALLNMHRRLLVSFHEPCFAHFLWFASFWRMKSFIHHWDLFC